VVTAIPPSFAISAASGGPLVGAAVASDVPVGSVTAGGGSPLAVTMGADPLYSTTSGSP